MLAPPPLLPLLESYAAEYTRFAACSMRGHAFPTDPAAGILRRLRRSGSRQRGMVAAVYQMSR